MALLSVSGTAAGRDVHIDHLGLRLNGELVMAAGRSLKDGVVLMTHGMLAHHRMELIQSLQDMLKTRGISSLAITLSLGISNRTGMYDCAVPHRHRRQDALGEIAVWLAWLKAQGAEQIVLFGHSAGGHQTAWFAAEHPSPEIRGVALLAPLTGEMTPTARQYELANRTPLAKTLRTAQDALSRDPNAMLQNTAFLYCPGATVSAAAFVDYYHDYSNRHLIPLVGRIRAPVLLISGTQDTVVPGLPELLGPLANGKSVFARVIDGADHFFQDLFAEEVADVIAEFTRR